MDRKLHFAEALQALVDDARELEFRNARQISDRSPPPPPSRSLSRRSSPPRGQR